MYVLFNCRPSIYNLLVILFIYANIKPATLVTKTDETVKIPDGATLVDMKQKRSVDERNKACEMLISFDEPFWENKKRNMTELVEIANKHVQRLNEVFTDQIFIGGYNKFYFSLARVQVCTGIILLSFRLVPRKLLPDPPPKLKNTPQQEQCSL